MGTSAFGGASDLSQTLAYAYSQYQDHLTSLANRADQRATDEQRATDADMVDKWQSGDMSDAEFLAYAKQRNKDSFSDPQEKEYWSKALRNAQDTIKQRGIATTAQSIIDGVQAGKNTWNDLQKFYLGQRKSLRPNDPMYKQLSDQITQVNGQIRDNEVNGGIQKAEYLFKSGQISGTQAGSMVRSLAGRYKNEDTAKYYQLLQSASDLTTFGGTYTTGSGGGSGSSGGGGGGGGGRRRGGGGGGGVDTKTINGVIDAYQATRDALVSMSDQFEKGATVGVDSSGHKHLLRNPDGTPSAEMQAIDAQTMQTYDLLGQAYAAKGDHSAAEATAATAQKFLSGHIQPRNTIGPEEQLAARLGALKQQIAAAGRGNDPEGSASTLRLSLNSYRDWLKQLNTTRDVRHDPNAPINSTTPDFVNEATQGYDALEQAVVTGATGDLSTLGDIAIPAGMAHLLGGQHGILAGMAGVAQVVTGLQQGTMAWYMDPTDGLGVVPLRTEVGFDGKPIAMPVDPATGNALVKDISSIVPVVTTAGGKTIAALAPQEQVSVWNGPNVVANGVNVPQGAQLSVSDVKQLTAAITAGMVAGGSVANIGNYQRVVVHDGSGAGSAWFGVQQADGTTGWSNGLPTSLSYYADGKSGPQAPKPAIIAGFDAYHAVEIAQKMGLDPTAYYNHQDLRAQSPDKLYGSLAGNSGPVKYGGTYVPPVNELDHRRPTQNADMVVNDLPSSLRQMAQNLGINGPAISPSQSNRQRPGGADLLPSIPKSKGVAAPDNSAWLKRVRDNAALSQSALAARIKAATDSRPPLIPLPKISNLPSSMSQMLQNLGLNGPASSYFDMAKPAYVQGADRQRPG